MDGKEVGALEKKRKRDAKEKKAKKKKKKKSKRTEQDSPREEQLAGEQAARTASEEKPTVEEDAKRWCIDPRIVEGLKKNGVHHFFSIQRRSLPYILRGDEQKTGKHEDVCVSAPTGSGKTLVFVISTLQMLLDRVLTRLRALVVLPSRDLAIQVKSVFDWFCDDASVDYVNRKSLTRLSVGLAVGLKPLKDEQEDIVEMKKWDYYNNTMDKRTSTNGSNGVTAPELNINNGFSRIDILVCTPGRLMDHVRHTPGFSLQHLRVLVVDEADRLMAQSYQGWVASVLSASRSVQNILPSRVLKSCLGINGGTDELFFDSSVLPERQYDGSDSGRTLRVLSGSLRKLLFSATLTDEPDKMVNLNLVNPRFISLQRTANKNDSDSDGSDANENEDKTYKFQVPQGLSENVVVCESRDKPIVLFQLLENLVSAGQRTLVFVSSVDSTFRLCTLLKIMEEKFDPMKRNDLVEKTVDADAGTNLDGLPTIFGEYSGRLSRSKRSMVLRDFREANSPIAVLICSDAMARGLDIELVDNVVNYDLPVRPETYVHRVGRAARAGRSGRSFSFLKPSQMQAYNNLIDDIKINERIEYNIDPERLGKAIPDYTKALLLLKDRLETGRKSAKDATNGKPAVHKKVAKRWKINIGEAW